MAVNKKVQNGDNGIGVECFSNNSKSNAHPLVIPMPSHNLSSLFYSNSAVTGEDIQISILYHHTLVSN